MKSKAPLPTVIQLFFVLILLISCANEGRRSSRASNFIPEEAPVADFSAQNDLNALTDSLMAFLSSSSNQGAVSNNPADEILNIPIHELSVSESLDLFKESNAVTSCGIASKLLVAELSKYGIGSFSYNFGHENSKVNHVIVVAKIGSEWLILDPLFNGKWYLKGENQQVDFFEALRLSCSDSLFLNLKSYPMEVELIVSEEMKSILKQEGCMESDSVPQKILVSYSADSMRFCGLQQSFYRETGKTFVQSLDEKIYSVEGFMPASMDRRVEAFISRFSN